VLNECDDTDGATTGWRDAPLGDHTTCLRGVTRTVTHPTPTVDHMDTTRGDTNRGDTNQPAREATDDVAFTVVDFETTGLDPSTDRILQVAALVVDADGAVVDSFDTIVKPQNPDEFENSAAHVNGISDEQVLSGMPLKEALERVWSMSRGRWFTAHNARFDIGFLHAESARVGIEDTLETWIDTLALARSIDTEHTRRHSLSALCEHYGIERERAHEALSDARATAELLVHLTREIGLGSPRELPGYFAR